MAQKALDVPIIRALSALLLFALLASQHPVCPEVTWTGPEGSTETRLTEKKTVQLGSLLREEHSRPVSVAAFRPQETPAERFSAPVLFPVDLMAGGKPVGVTPSRRTAPSLTGTVVLLL